MSATKEAEVVTGRRSTLSLYGQKDERCDDALSIRSSGAEEAEQQSVKDTRSATSSPVQGDGGEASITKEAEQQYIEYVDSAKSALVRDCGGKLVVADMKTGPGGFAVAVLGAGDEIVTEIPNLLLEMDQNVTAGAAASGKQQPLRRPAAAPKRTSEELGPAPKRPPPELLQRKWHKMWYTNTQKVGIRRAWPGAKEQIASFGRKGWSKEEGMRLADECIAALVSGALTEDDVKQWASARM